MTHRDVLERKAVWTAADYIVICEWASPSPSADFQRRYRNQAKHQGPDNSVFGNVESPANVDIDHAYRVSDEDWETGVGDEARVSLS
jgi:hypothetical protein